LRAALELIERASRIQVNGRPLQIGVGLNTGLAIVGAIGSKQRLDFTAIGSTVNVAARLCGVAQQGEVLSSTDTLLRAGAGVASSARPTVVLKGLETPMVPHLVTAVAEPLKLIQLMQPIQLQQPVVPIPLQLVAPAKVSTE
jgi:adenylate cyclase